MFYLLTLVLFKCYIKKLVYVLFVLVFLNLVIFRKGSRNNNEIKIFRLKENFCDIL